jgi:hypothetical protein
MQKKEPWEIEQNGSKTFIRIIIRIIRLQPTIATQASLPPSNPGGHPPAFGMKMIKSLRSRL